VRKPEKPDRPDETETRSEEIVTDGIKFITQGMSAYDKLKDATEEELFAQLRTSDGHIELNDPDPEDTIMYSVAMFQLKHRGYEINTEDGTVFVTDENGDVAYEKQFRDQEVEAKAENESESE
jgi:predicted nucleic acid-binding protein